MLSSAIELVKQLAGEFSKFQDIRKLQLSNQINSYITQVNYLTEKLKLQKHTIYTTLCDIILCCSCKTNFSNYVLECSHQFCGECLVNKAGITSQFTDDLYIDSSFPKCPECSEIIAKKEAAKISQILWPDSGNQTVDSQRIKCKMCGIIRAQTKFCYDCLHFCIFCKAELAKNSEAVCPFCTCSTFRKDCVADSANLECLCCNKKKKPDDVFLEFCEEHAHCSACSKEAWMHSACKHCNKPLSPKTIKYIESRLFKKCKVCKNMIENKFVTKKLCCDAHICGYCEKNSENGACRSCKAEIRA